MIKCILMGVSFKTQPRNKKVEVMHGQILSKLATLNWRLTAWHNGSIAIIAAFLRVVSAMIFSKDEWMHVYCFVISWQHSVC